MLASLWCCVINGGVDAASLSFVVRGAAADCWENRSKFRALSERRVGTIPMEERRRIPSPPAAADAASADMEDMGTLALAFSPVTVLALENVVKVLREPIRK